MRVSIRAFANIPYDSLCNPVPWIHGGSPVALAAGFEADSNIAFRGFSHSTVMLWSWTGGVSLWAGSYCFWDFFMIPTSYGIPSLSP